MAKIPGGLRPGQISIVTLGRVIMGDVAVTLVDLAQRGLVDVIEHGSDGAAQWTITARNPSASRRDSLLGYEQRLLERLHGYGGAVQLDTLATEFGPALGKVRTELTRDAVHRGWLRHLTHERTPQARELSERVWTFQRQLRQLKTEHGEDALAGAYLPCALKLNLVSRERIPLARFAQAWVTAFSGLEGWSEPQHNPGDTDEVRNSENPWGGMPRGMGAPPTLGWRI